MNKLEEVRGRAPRPCSDPLYNKSSPRTIQIVYYILTYKRIPFFALNETCIVPSLDQCELDYALINRLLSTIYLKYYDSLTLDHKS